MDEMDESTGDTGILIVDGPDEMMKELNDGMDEQNEEPKAEMETEPNQLVGGVSYVKSFALGKGRGKLVLSKGSVVDFRGDAIVNAANRSVQGGGGVDGAITRAGGPALREARANLPVIHDGARCLTGDAVVTIGGDLPVSWVIHAVGPNYSLEPDQEAADQLLYSAYQKSMQIAKNKKLKTIGFSLISSGIYRGRSRSLADVLSIAVRALAENSYKGLAEVHLVAFLEEEASTLLEVATRIMVNKEYREPKSSGCNVM